MHTDRHVRPRARLRSLVTTVALTLLGADVALAGRITSPLHQTPVASHVQAPDIWSRATSFLHDDWTNATNQGRLSVDNLFQSFANTFGLKHNVPNASKPAAIGSPRPTPHVVPTPTLAPLPRERLAAALAISPPTPHPHVVRAAAQVYVAPAPVPEPSGLVIASVLTGAALAARRRGRQGSGAGPRS